ncbi:hypothetical protein [Flexithrix dorotheae]|uniref:hypothetical protein n=1 Tax=Flexithrix dorotheae TaxID=70993 RepID=UPI00037C90A1|nr:hypothetical protein [Flexithrix dorotheae]
MNTAINTQENTALNTFRNLSTPLRSLISINEIFEVLREKANYYNTLTYTQKCIINTSNIAGTVQRRLRKKNIRLTKNLVKSILKAEEQYYQNLTTIY